MRDIFSWDISLYLKKYHNTEYIIDIADNYPEVFKSRFRSKTLSNFLAYFYNLSEKIAVKNSRFVFVVTDYSKNLLIKKHKLKPESISILNNYPQRSDVLTPKSCLKPINVSSKPSLVYVGTVDQKVRNLDDVLSYIKDTDIELNIYSYNKETIEKMVDIHQVKDNVKIHEPVKRSNLIKSIRKYDIGIIPHKLILGTEYTVPNKLYDYIHSEVPILATKNKAMTREIQNLGVGRTYNNKKTFYHELYYLINNKDKYLNHICQVKHECVWEKQNDVIKGRLL
ncbi:glycosyltransferase [Salinicoccus bachuensis]|uniref:Glycosyltransferase n=1 Tax=Salinicoccus bachuensis TaxID=3136731 RepID=A0ABZ3CLD6_9STAP